MKKNRIPREFVLDLLARISILDVIGKRVKMKKRGNNYFGCCPFHDEKTASFSLSEKKQIFHCFGCGKSGDVIEFLREYDRLSYFEAIEELANMLGIAVPYEQSNSTHTNSSTIVGQNTRRDIYALMDRIVQFYQYQLDQSTSELARNYLIQRGLNTDIIKRYRIGYSPDSWDLTYKSVANNQALANLYDQAGMLVKNDNGRVYDRFRGRIMFPIRDRQGNTIGFGGRTITNESAKYLNSPDTAIFHKGYQLYGLYEALEQERNPTRLLVVEGYMDVVSLAQFGINYSVAALGTATTEEHIKLLFRATDHVIFCYDGDEAGRRAAWKALNVLLPTLVDGKQISFVFLPEADDPDSFIRKQGVEAFEDYLNNAQTLSKFLYETLLKQVDLKTSEGKAKLSSLALPLLVQIKAPSFSLNLRQQLGSYLGMLDMSQIDKLLQDHTSQKQNDTVSSVISRPVIKMKLTVMRILIGLLLQYPYLSKLVANIDAIRQANLAGVNIFVELLELCRSHPNITTAQILMLSQEKTYVKQLHQLATWEHLYVDDEIESIFSHTLKELYDNILAQRQDELIAKERVSGLDLAEKKELVAIIKVLSKKN